MVAFATLLLLLVSCLGRSTPILKWSNVPITSGDTIHFPDDMIATGRHTPTKAYTDQRRLVSQYNLDEKCALGMNLSMGFLPYTPYIDTGVPLLTIDGMIPALIKLYLGHCCPKSNVTYGQLYGTHYEIESSFGRDDDHDLTFPVYALHGRQTVIFKDRPVIPIVQAPKVVLLVRNSVFVERDTRTQVLMKTIFNAWPMLIFIFVSACLSGLLVWVLDRKQNASEFPPAFFHGAWEGFWWAFVTMTTVGYGDRSPKSALARAFCIIWILTGVIIISLFTGLVSAALSTSATPVFNIPGAKIGAVIGSQEYEFGVSMNADMAAYGSVPLLFQAVLAKELQGIFVDNFVLSGAARMEQIKKLRMFKEFDKPITYGLVLPKNSTRVEKCFRSYLNDYPHEIFTAISKHLKPFKNTADDVSIEVQSAEKLFYEEQTFKQIVFAEIGILVVCLVIGMVWEYCIRHNGIGKYRMMLQGNWKNDKNRNSHGNKHNYEGGNGVRISTNNNELDAMIREYDKYHNDWMQRIKSLKDTSSTHEMISMDTSIAV